MGKASRPYQIFTKPVGPVCNLRCEYCYYLKTRGLYPDGNRFRMPDDLLERYIVQHMETCPDPVVGFSWHGGEPTILGLEYFRTIVSLQRKHKPAHLGVVNGIQTNGTLLDDEWCRFLSEEGFAVGISIDGPEGMHDSYRVTAGGGPSFREAMRGYELLQRYEIGCDVLCVVHAQNTSHPGEVYRFFKQIHARNITFLPLVEKGEDGAVTPRSVTPEGFGNFLCSVFDEWAEEDVGRIKVQIFEEAARTALGEGHTLCIFRRHCGDVPVLEHNGDFFPCDHYVGEKHRLGNIRETPLVDLIQSPKLISFGRRKWETLPQFCLECDVLHLCNGGCPKDRILQTPGGEAGLNYLCAGYKRFFLHARGFLDQLSALERVHRGSEPLPPHRKIGRNDPCPCGSGRKYKKCCMGKLT